MRKPKPNSGIWNYLNAAGVLDGGSDEAIKRAKHNYRKSYLLKYKQRQRADKPECTVSFSKENGEYERVLAAAKKHNLKITTFVRAATLSYMSQNYLVPNRVQIGKLEQLLSESLNEVQKIARQKERFNWDREQKYEAIEKLILRLERNIGEVFRNPPLLPNHDNKNQIT